MGLIRKIFWVAVFLAATFAWVVLFGYGPGNFEEGAKVEWENVKNFTTPVQQKKDQSDKLP